MRKHNPGVKIVYAGTRQIYGKPDRLPVDETHLLNPTDVNGINKIAGELYHLVYNYVYGIRACSLRLTNTYGPRQLTRHNRQGFIGWFMRKVTLGEEIQLFGDGEQKRDFDYVDDVVDAFLRAGALDGPTARCSTSAAASPFRIANWSPSCWRPRDKAQSGSSTGRTTSAASTSDRSIRTTPV